MALTEGTRVIQQGMLPVKITLAAACLAGDLLGYSSGWKPADADAAIFAELVAGQKGSSGDEITAYRLAVVDGYTGGTAGTPLYLSDTAGRASETAGTVGQVVGLVMSTTVAMLAPAYNIGGQILPAALKKFFRDSGLFIYSQADGKLTVSSDGSGTDDITLDGTVTVNDTLTLAAGKSIVGAAGAGGIDGSAMTGKLKIPTGGPVPDNGAASATAGAATLDKIAGVITSEALTTAAGAAYTLTLTCNKVAAADMVLVSFTNGTNTQGTLALGEVTPGAGSMTIVIRNIHASQALNGTIKISYLILKAS